MFLVTFQTVRRVPPAGLEMSEISEISIRLTDYKRKRLVLPDVSTVQVQFSDEADMNNVYQKVSVEGTQLSPGPMRDQGQNMVFALFFFS